MKLYVWQGKGIFREYSSGLVVIVAETPVHAWAKLRAVDERAFWHMRLGHPWVANQEEYDEAGIAREPDNGAPFDPVEYELDPTLPPFIEWGGG